MKKPIMSKPLASGKLANETEAAMAKSERSNLEGLEALLVERKVSRASFLRLLGVGIELSLVPASLGLLRGEASIAQTSEAATASILSGGQYPIGIWWPPPPKWTSQARYAEIVRAGFNFVIGGNGVVNDDTNPAALDAAAANGLRFLLTDSRLKNLIEESATASGVSAQEAQDSETLSIMRYLLDQEKPESANSSSSDDFSAQATSEDVRQRIERLLLELYKSGDYPALSGLNLYDEPPRNLFASLGYARGVMRQIAPNKLPYVIALPSYVTQSTLGSSTYEGYLEHYMKTVNPPVLSFGHYPLLREGITLDYFYNWAQIRKYSLRFGVPSWVFIQSLGFNSRMPGFKDRRRPNEAEIRWQVNVSLAYGAKGIQYFTYWTPDDTPNIEFGQALISRSGNRTPVYGYARDVNAYLKVIGRELLPLISETVVHAREKRLPLGARPFRADTYVRSVSGSPIILGRSRKPGLPSARYFFVANRSFSRVAKSRLKVSRRVRRVFRLDIGTGRYVRVALRGTPKRELPVRLAPGSARLYVLRRG